MNIKIIERAGQDATSYVYDVHGVITVDSTHDHYNNKTYICQWCQYEQHLRMLHYIFGHIYTIYIETHDTMMTTPRPHTPASRARQI